MGTITDADDTAADPGDMHALTDPEFITLWASLLGRLARTPAGSAAYPVIKGRYDEAKAEFRRRLDGGL
jgi:hypothetical protein